MNLNNLWGLTPNGIEKVLPFRHSRLFFERRENKIERESPPGWQMFLDSRVRGNDRRWEIMTPEWSEMIRK